MKTEHEIRHRIRHGQTELDRLKDVVCPELLLEFLSSPSCARSQAALTEYTQTLQIVQVRSMVLANLRWVLDEEN